MGTVDTEYQEIHFKISVHLHLASRLQSSKHIYLKCFCFLNCSSKHNATYFRWKHSNAIVVEVCLFWFRILLVNIDFPFPKLHLLFYLLS